MGTYEDLFKRFTAEYGKLTYREMSEITGLNITRLFRLYNGSPIKAHEITLFKKLISQRAYGENSLREIFEECLEKMPPKVQKELELVLLRKLAIIEMLAPKEEEAKITKKKPLRILKIKTA